MPSMILLVTPAHQFPTGVVLAPERRAALLEWASRHEAVVIEDDSCTPTTVRPRSISWPSPISSNATVSIGT